ncbi:MAG: C-terminal binding protein [Megasphaera sp.]|jgi:D-3-phosphoglycerate dehydrogenase|uniref:C-terminal binding protein n=1 Tax=Megasphaera sueciensis TaxID=349094 RepID=UPI002ACB121B|nr:C-terminal binding protein [Megasphaera sp.]
MKIYVTDYDYPSLDIERSEIQKINAQFIPTQSHTAEEVIANCRDADALLNQYTIITNEVMEKLTRLKVICRYGVGIDSIDIEAASAHGICVVNVPDYCIDEVSNHAIALIMTCWRKIAYLNTCIRSGIWDYTVARPLHRFRGCKLGIVGFGKIGREVARKMQPFGLKIMAYDPYFDAGDMTNMGVTSVPFFWLLREADIISVHTPLTEETFHLFNEETFTAMKETAIFINTSRGAVVEEVALVHALQQKKIAAAAIDVLEQEPINQGNPLAAMDNVVLTPHFSWYSEESEKELKHKVAMGACEVLLGKIPTYLVNRNVLENISLR